MMMLKALGLYSISLSVVKNVSFIKDKKQGYFFNAQQY